MTFDEALAVLGVTHDAAKDDVRRAYLRLVKRHKPERDPDGFARVREAYDIVSSGLAWVVAHKPIVAPSAPAASVPLEPEESIAAARERLDDAPTDAQRCFELIDALDAAERWDESDDVVLDAMRREVPGFRAEAMARAPQKLKDEELRAIDADTDEWVQSQVVHELAHRGDRAGAAVILIRALDSSLDEPRRGEASAREAPWLVLELLAAGDVTMARRVYDALRRWLDTTRSEARLYHDRTAVLLGIARELSALPATFPSPVMKAIATSALDGELYGAVPALESHALVAPASAATALSMLRKRAPFLVAALGPALQGQDAPVIPKPATGARWPWIALAIFGLSAVRVVSTCNRSQTSTPTPSSATGAFAERPSPSETAPLEVFYLRARIDRECRSPTYRLRPACSYAVRLAEAIEGNRCDDARREMRFLNDALDELSTSPEDRVSKDRLAGVAANAARICRTDPVR